MATSSTKTNTAVPDFEAATERAREANERLLEAGRKVSTAYLDGVENYISGLAQFERKVAEQSQVDAVASLLGAHAELTEEITKVSVSAAREMIAA
ncbi:MAG TPA: hypothetical protein VIL82_07175 [Solirubrobacteraceae bacterium]|jgi:hypothetical protein